MIRLSLTVVHVASLTRCRRGRFVARPRAPRPWLWAAMWHATQARLAPVLSRPAASSKSGCSALHARWKLWLQPPAQYQNAEATMFLIINLGRILTYQPKTPARSCMKCTSAQEV